MHGFEKLKKNVFEEIKEVHEPILFHNTLTSYLETNIKTEIIRFWSIKMKLYRFKTRT